MHSTFEQLELFFRTHQRIELPDSQLTRAAVLVPIFERRGEPFLLLTKRTNDVEHHKGQISFPGGTVDAGDKDILATALRETEEEIGLASDRIQILGIIDDIAIPTGFVVTPVVGFVDEMPPLKPNKMEVDSVLEVPFSFFRNSENKKIVKMMRGGELRDVHFFNFGEHQIWGATAAIIDSFFKKFEPI